MSIATVVTRGYGSFGSIADVTTRGYTIGAAAAVFASITGSTSDGVLEQELRVGWQDIFITLTGSTWDTGQNFNDARQAIIDGLDSATNQSLGWNAELRDKITPQAVTRISDEVVKVLLPTSGAYQIASNETITVTVPPTAHSDGTSLTASPAFLVTADSESGITNAGATLTASQYEICERTGFRELPRSLVRDGYRWRTREQSADPRHPQELIRSKTDKLPGSVAPEQDDVFLSDGEVTADDL